MFEVIPFFRSFLQAGFECSTHRNSCGQRLDLIRSTKHDDLADDDFKRLSGFGIHTARSAARWHLIEEVPGVYDFRSLEHLLNAADAADVELVLDILHFGWPDHIDVFSAAFPGQFARFTEALVRFLKRRGRFCPMLAPVNEISYLSWAGGDKGVISPFAVERGREFKHNLVRAAVASCEVLLNEVANVRLISPEPVIYIAGDPTVEGDVGEAQAYTLAQFEAWDMMCGRLNPELGGRPEYLDIIGTNFYPKNEWVHNAGPLRFDDPRFRPFHQILEDVWERYRRPMFVSETGTEDDTRSSWLNYVCDEVAIALSSAVPVLGICWYPILNHPGWDDDRHCHNGLFDFSDAQGEREIHQPLAEAILHQQKRFFRGIHATYDSQTHRPDLLLSSKVGIRFSTSSAPDEPVRS